MIQVTPQMRIVAAIEPVDFRCGIDGLARLCKDVLSWTVECLQPMRSRAEPRMAVTAETKTRR